MAAPSKKYQIVYADPPWAYENKKVGGNGMSGAEAQYPTMNIEAIKKLGVKKITDSNAILFLWATSPLLPDALEVMKAWGFQYKSSAVWDKMTVGIGYWFRGQHEFLLVGTRGNVSPPPTTVTHFIGHTQRQTRPQPEARLPTHHNFRVVPGLCEARNVCAKERVGAIRAGDVGHMGERIEKRR